MASDGSHNNNIDDESVELIGAKKLFSDDLERLQKINRIRKSPIGAQIKRVIDLLLEKRPKALDPQEIYEACYVDVVNNLQVFNSLKNNNPKVHFDGVRFSYKQEKQPAPDINVVTNSDQLFGLLQKYPDGISVIDLQECYAHPNVNVIEELESLKAAGMIWLISGVAYPNLHDPMLEEVDQDLKELYHEIELPDDIVDIGKYLQKHGEKPATDIATRMAMAAAATNVVEDHHNGNNKKVKKITKRTKLTNTHLPHLFVD